MGLILRMRGWCIPRRTRLRWRHPRNSEERKLDLALVDVGGIVLALVYVERGVEVRAISLRRASRIERRIYENAQQD